MTTYHHNYDNNQFYLLHYVDIGQGSKIDNEEFDRPDVVLFRVRVK